MRHPCQRWRLVAATVVLALAAGCASTPGGDRDGAEAHPPSNLEDTPDAVPRVEPLRVGGPNKPYQVYGVSYVPITTDRSFKERGLASWYGKKFHGRPTASGEIYNMYAMTAAHPTLPIPSYVRVRNPANGRSIIVRVNDRGPFHKGRIIDLSYTAALKLGTLKGVVPVEIERLTHEQIRTGAWRRIGPSPGGEPVEEARETQRAGTPSAQGYWVQLGAFRDPEGAIEFQRDVVREHSAVAPLLAIFDEASWHRVQAGPYATREEAQDAAERLRSALRITPLIVQRR